MNRSTDWSRATTRNLQSKKGILFASVAVAAVADIAALAVLLYEGAAWMFVLISALMLAADLAFLLLIAVSNYRFKYARAQWVVYILLTLLLTAAALVVNFAFGSTSMTLLAAAVIAAVHVVGVIVIFFAALRAAGTRRSPELPGMVVALVVLLICTAAYAGFTIEGGYFGQGEDNVVRAVIFEEDGDGYAVTGVSEGRGNTVVIPEKINGKEITSFSAELFADDSIEKIVVESEEYIPVDGLSASRLYAGSVKMEVHKNNIDLYKAALYDTRSSWSRGFASIANAMTPIGLDEGEVYITFAYDASGLSEAGGDYIPTWFGSAGDRADISEMVGDIPYADHNDVNDVNDLHHCYLYNGRMIMQARDSETGALFTGGRVNGSMRLDVNFERVFRVSLGAGNDTKYTAPSDFAAAVINGVRQSYSYVTAPMANDFAARFPEREGFDLAWDLGFALGGVSDDISASLSTDKAQSSVSSFVMNPVWTMHSPEVSILGSGNVTSLTYGDPLTLEAEVIAPFDGCEFVYEWKDAADEVVSQGETYSALLPLPADSGTYSLTVTAKADSTSLTSEGSATRRVSISKRQLELEWSVPTQDSGNVYTGYDFTVSASPVNAVSGDDITVTADPGTVRNAGSYTARASIDAESGEKYRLAAGTASMAFSILPHSVDAPEWGSETSFVYDGESHAPTAAVQGVGPDGALTVTVQGGAVNAGSYTATAAITGENAGNYVIVDKTTEFEITARPVTVEWTGQTFTYNGGVQHPIVQSVSGEVEGEESDVIALITYSYTDCVNAGTHTVTAQIADGENYKFEAEQAKEFEIDKMALEINARDAEKVYDGKIYGFTTADISVGTLADGDSLFEVVSSVTADGAGAAAVNAGSTEFELTLGHGEKYENYSVSGDLTATLKINKRTVTMTWESTSFVYDGTARYPKAASVGGAVSGEEESVRGSIVYGGDTSATKAGSYTVTAELPDDSNYTFSAAQRKTFAIAKRPVTVVWTEQTFTYNGKVQHPTVQSVDGEVEGEESTVIGLITYLGTADCVNAGTHTVTAQIAEGNYTFSVPQSETFEIAKLAVTVVWAEQTFIYNGDVQHPTVQSVDGEVEGEESAVIGLITYSYTDCKNAGTHTVTAQIAEGNYTFSVPQSKTFEIAKLAVTVVWEEQTFIYNGKVQYPRVQSVKGAVSGEEDVVLGALIYGGDTEAKNAGGYTVNVTLSEESNYKFDAEQANEFTIAQRGVTLVWEESSFVYDGNAHHPSVVSVENAAPGEEAVLLGEIEYSGDIEATDAGGYAVTASIADDNYTITGGGEKAFTISAAPVSVSWSGTEFEEDATAHFPEFICDFEGIKVEFEYYEAIDGERGEKLESAPSAAGSYIVVAAIEGAENFIVDGETECAFSIVAAQDDAEQNGGESI